MKSENLNDDLVKILVDEYLDPGWKYNYWGKKITAEDFEITNTEFQKYVAKVVH